MHDFSLHQCVLLRYIVPHLYQLASQGRLIYIFANIVDNHNVVLKSIKINADEFDTPDICCSSADEMVNESMPACTTVPGMR